MKLSFNTWVYSSFPVWVPAYPLEIVIQRLAKIGYDGIEIGAAAPHAFPDYLTPQRRKDIKNILDDNGIAVSSMLPAPGGGAGYNVASQNPLERLAAVEMYKKVTELCAQWGGETLLYVAGWQTFGTTRKDAWSWSRDGLAEVADFAAQYNITVCVEPTSADSNLIDSCDDTLDLIEQVAKPNVAAMFDTFHTLYRNEVPTDYIYRMAEQLKHIHLADIDRQAPGNGIVDYPSIIAALKEVNYDGYITMEIGFNRRNVEPDEIARSAHDYIRGLI